jgi:mono/diheme cytochrome c family protein
MLKPLLVATAAAAFAFSVASSAPQDANQTTAPTANAQTPSKTLSPDARARAKKLYAQECALCHGGNGNGKSDLATAMKLTLADLTDPKTLAGKSDSDLFALIRKGNGQMPPEDPNRAKDDAVWNLILYIRSMPANSPAAAPAAEPAPEAPPAS